MKETKPIQKLLAANRSEIAIRIFRAANELGLRTVGIYSQEDRLGLHRFKADEAYQIGEGKGPVEAYLDIAGIVALAKEKGVDAIHPGYGFLSENPAFARACETAGITFVGPTPSSPGIAWRQDCRAKAGGFRRRARAAGHRRSGRVSQRSAKDRGGDRLSRHREGRDGRRRARHARGARSLRNWRRCSKKRRARRASAFGNASVFLEKYLPRARHIEVQILGDQHGNLLHFYERDCSVQRRHQKVVEVAPGGESRRPAFATSCAKPLSVSLAKPTTATPVPLSSCTTWMRSKWYFIEVNPRIQVEHTVTEMVTGIDLVRSQILVAQGHSLHDPPMSLPRQENIPLYGAALQCRVTTEDPEKNFAPDYGKISTYRSPAGFGIRLDGGTAYAGAVLAAYYDSLLVKVTAWGQHLPEACHRMDRALREFRIRGVKTNIPVRRKRRQSPEISRRRNHHIVSG